MHRNKGNRKRHGEKPEWHNEEAEIDPDLKAKKPLLFNTKNVDGSNAKKKLEENKKKFYDESNKFKWLKVIGQGTFGVVYKAAYQEDPTKIVAIKKVFQDPKYSNREFKIVQELDHPNCIKVILIRFISISFHKERRRKMIFISIWSWITSPTPYTRF